MVCVEQTIRVVLLLQRGQTRQILFREDRLERLISAMVERIFSGKFSIVASVVILFGYRKPQVLDMRVSESKVVIKRYGTTWTLREQDLLMAQCLAPRISGGVFGHSSDGLCSTEIHGIIAPSHLRVFGN